MTGHTLSEMKLRAAGEKLRLILGFRRRCFEIAHGYG